MAQRNVLIMGAAGKDFHVFNTCYRDQADFRVVAFTATQIPHIDDRRYPAALAGSLYPDGIPIHPEEELVDLIRKHAVDEVIFAYSDVTNDYVEERAKLCRDAGAEFKPFDVEKTMIESTKPVVAVVATRTGCGKSQTSRWVVETLTAKGLKVIAIRHPMPYGDLAAQAVQRFAHLDDLVKHKCTIEEMEEYEPHIARGGVIYAGVDYEAILREAEKEADVILWDGGNNDTPFYKPDLWITVADPHRAGHELRYFPSLANFEGADVIVINKCNTAEEEGIQTVEANAAKHNPKALVLRGDSPVTLSDPDAVKGKRVLVVEDGPTLTHGEMKYGAGTVAVQQAGGGEIVDPRPYAVGEIQETFEKYPDIGVLLPAMGYGDAQMADLKATIDATDCDVVVVGTPIDLVRVIDFTKPAVRVTYDLAMPDDRLEKALEGALAKKANA